MRRRTRMRTRSVENCRLTHPTGGWSAMPMTSLSIFHTLMTRQRKAAKGAKWAKGDGDGPDGEKREDEERLKCNPVTASPKGCRPDEGEGKPDPKWKSKDWGHAKCCQLHCTIFAHIESGNFDNLRNFKNVLMNCNILNNEFCEPCAISPPYFFYSLFFLRNVWLIETGQGDWAGRDAAIRGTLPSCSLCSRKIYLCDRKGNWNWN